MKKIILSITAIISLFCLTTKVYAKSYSVSITGSDTFEEEITLTIKVSNLVDFNGPCEGLCGMTAILNYDSSKLELVSLNKLNDFGVTHNKDDNSLVFERDMGVASGSGVATIIFKNKGLAKDESAVVSLTNIVATDGSEDITTNNASKTVKFIVKDTSKDEEKDDDSGKNNNTGTNNNTTTNTGTSNNSSTGNSTNNSNKKEEIKKSDNNYLDSIVLSAGKINFDKEQLTYDVIVDYDVDTIKIEATTEDEKAQIDELRDEYLLNVGENVITLIVKAEDDSERTYTIRVNREKKDIIVEDEEENKVVDETKDVEKSNNIVYIIIIFVLVVVITVLSVVLFKNRKK